MSTALIIGGGVTGLSAGIHLLQPGHIFNRVMIVERHARAGGNLTAWTRGGCTIDNCVHWLTGTSPASGTHRLWETLGVLDGSGDDVVRPESLFTAEAGGGSVTLRRSLDRTAREMRALSPADRVEIDRFIGAVAAMREVCGLDPSEGVESSDRRPPVSPSAWARLGRYASLSAGALGDRFRHPALRQFMTVFGRDAFTSLALILTCAHFTAGNADLPRGGSAAMARRMTDRFLSLGGVLRTGCRAVSVDRETERDGTPGTRAVSVTLADGEVIPCDEVIVTADPASVFGPGALLDAPMPPRLARMYEGHETRFSALHAAFACRRGALGFSGDLALPLLPDAAGLPDFPGASACRTVLFRSFSHEPSFAPEGEEVVQAAVFCPEEAARAVIGLSRTPEKYAAFKRAFSDSMRRVLTAARPAVSDSLRLLDVWTPATYRRFTGAPTGSFMGFTLRPGVIPRRLDGRVPGLFNVRLAGQWLRSPGGLPLAADEGRRAAREAEEGYTEYVEGKVKVAMFGR